MKIAFYAPLKPPTHTRPSGDRTLGRLLLRALEHAGFEPELASVFRSRDGAGDERRQRRIATIGSRLATRLLRRYLARPFAERPRLWFTYHLYYKAPDWLGPVVSAALGIPYVVAEASFTPSRRDGRWAFGHRSVATALAHCDAVLSLNPADDACVRPLLRDPARLHGLAPCTDVQPATADDAVAARLALAARHGLPGDVPWLLCAAMMRHGAKLASYRVLAEALASLRDRPWHLLVAGAGEARAEVQQALQPLGAERFTLLGELDAASLASTRAACDLFAWPAVDEAFGMAILEAQAAGLPVVAGAGAGVAGIVRDGSTAVLAPAGDARAFADALAGLLADPQRRARMSALARKNAAEHHDVASAAGALRRVLLPLTQVPEPEGGVRQ